MLSPAADARDDVGSKLIIGVMAVDEVANAEFAVG